MKITTDKKEYQLTGGTSKTFSVDTNDTMVIKLLRDKMYKNKIGAVAREISSNSRDANREAGRGNTPIIISVEGETNLLSADSSSISFQDNGVGISPERMDNIFLKYGGSTKRESDKFTGGFGIGAKTPFAYTDNFFISTIVEENGKRIEYLYQAIITSDGKDEVSRMIELGSSETKSQTGTKISVPLKNEEDRIKFENEVLFVTRFWSTKPTLIGFESQENNVGIIYENENIIAFNQNEMNGEKTLFDNNVKYVALIDEIPYPLNHETLQNELKQKVSTDHKSTKWILKFKTGEVSVSGSREDIEYTTTNLQTIYDKYLSVLKEGEQLIKEYQNKPKSFMEACIYADSLRNSARNYYSYRNQHVSTIKYSKEYLSFLGGLVSAMSNDEEAFSKSEKIEKICLPLYKGEQTITNFFFDTIQIDTYEMDNNNRMVKARSKTHTSPSSTSWSKPIFMIDTAKVEPTRNARLKLDYADKGYMLIKKLDFTQWSNAQYGAKSQTEYDLLSERDDKLFKLLNLKTSKYSDVEKLRNLKATSRGKVDVVNVNVRVLKKQSWETSWESATIKYDKKGEVFVNSVADIDKHTNGQNIKGICYVSKNKLSDFKTDRYSSSTNALTKEEEVIRQMLLANGIQTIGVSSSKLGYFKNVPTIEEAFIKLVDEDKSNSILNCIKSSVIKANGLHYTELLSNLKTGKKLGMALDRLYETYTKNLENSNKNLSIKTMSGIFEKNISPSFLNKININLDEQFKQDLKLSLETLDRNPIVNLILKIKNTRSYGGYRIERNGTEFKNIVKSMKNMEIK